MIFKFDGLASSSDDKPVGSSSQEAGDPPSSPSQRISNLSSGPDQVASLEDNLGD